MDIRNEKDLKLAYEHINFMKKVLEQVPGALKNTNAVKYIRETKESIRKYNKRTSDRILVKDYGIDGFVELIKFPQDISMENAEDYFEENEHIPMHYSAYDCTGRAFTGWHKLFLRHGNVMCYHRVCMDV